ncbi:MFS transporter [Streptomyces sp. WP-1]|uniref:MFS transporter n=1 Tax=Streptomyces sp. WP-1 TaxID=3041497 RepID=UPI0026493A9F|nr:MFS transporter [Streptomyces sp. WP-1]WKE67533.1 MFS transporter [Streptomyces sp. WP-1]
MQDTLELALARGSRTSPPRRASAAVVVCLTLLDSPGTTVVFPALPFVTFEYVHEGSPALWVGVLEWVNAHCAFLVALPLGALSGRLGRRPMLVSGAFGAAAGCALLCVGGALWVLVAARAVQGRAAGDMPAVFARVADITPARDRTKCYGLLGAVPGRSRHGDRPRDRLRPVRDQPGRAGLHDRADRRPVLLLRRQPLRARRGRRRLGPGSVSTHPNSWPWLPCCSSLVRVP